MVKALFTTWRDRLGWALTQPRTATAAYLGKGSQMMLPVLMPGLSVVMLGWSGLKQRMMWLGVGVFVALVLPWGLLNVSPYGSPLHSTQRHVAGYHGLLPWEEATFYPTLGRWIATHEPNTVIITRNPWELRLYMADTNKAVALPYDRPATLLEIARYDRVTHYLADKDRPGMYRLPYGRSAGFERIADAPRPLDKIHWDKLPGPIAGSPNLKLTNRPAPVGPSINP